MLRVTHPGCTLVAQTAADRSVYNTARLQCHHQWHPPAVSLLGWLFHHLSCTSTFRCILSAVTADIWKMCMGIHLSSTLQRSWAQQKQDPHGNCNLFFPILLFSFLIKPAEITVSAPYALPAQFLLNYLTNLAA